jgi:phage shock protein PspC (stress-responsive transcriptional regulator)
MWQNLKGATKSSNDRWIGGVCGGLGAATPLPSWMWRVAFLFSLLAFGVGLLLYLVLWICMPRDKSITV